MPSSNVITWFEVNLKRKFESAGYTVLKNRRVGFPHFTCIKDEDNIFVECGYLENRVTGTYEQAIKFLKFGETELFTTTFLIDMAISRVYDLVQSKKYPAVKCPECHSIDISIYEDEMKNSDILRCDNCKRYFYTESKKISFGKEKEVGYEERACPRCGSIRTSVHPLGWVTTRYESKPVVVVRCRDCNEYYDDKTGLIIEFFG